MKVPFLDLQAHHAPLRTEIHAAIEAVIDSGHFAGGPYVERFEQEFAAYCGTRHAVGVASGTDALWLSLMASRIGPGDEVITVPMSFFATAEAISFTGATPVFVDIDAATYTMDPARLALALTRRTKAIVPVHLFGQTADMGPILDFAEKHGLLVIEDAAQAHGAEYEGRKAGSLGDAGCFSFYPGKNLGGVGEAGAVITNDDELVGRIRMLREHGQIRKHCHSVIGWNSRMDGIQASVLSLKLRHLDRNNQRRRVHASYYGRYLSNIEGVIVPATGSSSKPVHHIYAIQVKDRKEVIDRFNREGIGYGLHYPVPIHLQPGYASLGHRKSDFPVSERCAERLISLPIFPEISSVQIDAVVDAVRQSSSALLSA